MRFVPRAPCGRTWVGRCPAGEEADRARVASIGHGSVFPFEELLIRRDLTLVGAPHLQPGRDHFVVAPFDLDSQDGASKTRGAPCPMDANLKITGDSARPRSGKS
jgi:hypothetical protein